MDREEENSSLVWTVSWSHDCRLQLEMNNMKALVWLSCLPVEKVLPNRAGTALSWRVPAQVIQLLVDSLQRHGDKVDFSNYSEIVTSACSTSFAFTYMPSRQINMLPA